MDDILRNREAPNYFNNETEFEAGSYRNLLSSISKKGKYSLDAVVKRSKFINTPFFGFKPEAIKKENDKKVNIQ